MGGCVGPAAEISLTGIFVFVFTSGLYELPLKVKIQESTKLR